MHEQSIVEALLSMALENAEQAEAVKIVRINLVVGDYAGVVEEALNFYFSFLSKNTIAAEAELCFTRMPAKVRCRACETIFSPDNSDYHCPRCNEERVDIIGGRELYLESLEVE